MKRAYIDDPLFVRTQHAMEPTPCAMEVGSSVDEMLDLYHSQLARRQKFDPAKSKRTFKIVASEVGHMMVFPRLIKILDETAPNIKLTAIPLGLHSLIGQLETGEIDMAFSSYPKLYAGLHERILYKEHYVCLVRADHPTIKDKLSLAGYEQAKPLIVSTQGLGHIHEQAEKQLYDICPEENIRVVTHNFLVSALLVEQSDYIATVPSKVAETLGGRTNLRILKPPIKVSSFDEKSYWHERVHRE